MTDKSKQKKKLNTKNLLNRLREFYKRIDSKRKIVVLVSVIMGIVASIVVIWLNNYFKEISWYTSNWIYFTYLTLLLILIFVSLSYKTLLKFSRLIVLVPLLIIFIMSSLVSAEFYNYALEMTKTTDTIQESNTSSAPSTKTETKVLTPEPEKVQSTPAQSTPTQSNNTSKPSITTDLGSTLDQYGCATNTPSYNQCVQNKIQLWCNNQVSDPASAFSSATTQARSAYNSVMNEWESAQYLTTHSPKSEYLADATSKFNAIYEPAYSTYFAKVQSLNSQGCNLQYPTHESAGQYW